MNLVIINSKKEAVTSHIIISDGMGVTQESTQELIKKYKKDLSELGVFRFQNGKPKSKGGRPTKEYMLNRDHSMFLITLMRNNSKTVNFKKRLVIEFSKMENWIKDRVQSSAEFKTMTGVLKYSRELAGKETKTYHYSNEARLINWAITGEFKAVDRKNLSANELALLNELQARDAVLIGAGMSYQRRKEALSITVKLWQSNQLERAA